MKAQRASRWWGAAISASSLLLMGANANAQGASESVKISRRPWYGLCAGTCPSYDISVEKNGAVETRTDVDLAQMAQIQRSNVPLASVARFRAILAPYRPRGERRTHAVCQHPVSAEEARLLTHHIEIEIRWTSPGASSRLIACDDGQDAQLLTAIHEALSTLGLLDTGHRATGSGSPN